MLPQRCVGRNQEQGHVVVSSQVGQLGGPVTMLSVRVGLVQSPGSPGGTFNVLVEFREHYFQFNMVKIPRDYMPCFPVFILLPTERVVEVAKGRASVGIRWYVHSSYRDNGKLTGKVNRPASDRDELQVSGACAYRWWMCLCTSCCSRKYTVLLPWSYLSRSSCCASVLWSFISSILFARDLALEKKTLGRCGRFRSWTRTPARHPRFCFLSLRRLLLLPAGMSAHGEPGVRANSGGMLRVYVKSSDAGCSQRNPIRKRSCRL
ncbi:hypothetical protein XENOCAPTIV_019353 [Xenoophorus captivus]|uniref:Uncharacterized protein n=1 Tax=Xenoophorus captivus TaxID=1517983 RepID=A0ABV0RIA8_9TELE